ncbi:MULTISPECIES: hypothetical protein [unclassified Crossiella]|uniref:hypothetical protein n=1 Tax=unclassified Crossiella TaxID=2620835 RepID=UPI001FFF2B11|nr:MULTISPECIES: hypothetical protein [unclassified Crossiella]MCK2237735.1 hypothetical protein [Crossiella sp. S99.2]MCK2255021.1 hypothetical protein [Crossiella sp. S99.1]
MADRGFLGCTRHVLQAGEGRRPAASNPTGFLCDTEPVTSAKLDVGVAAMLDVFEEMPASEQRAAERILRGRSVALQRNHHNLLITSWGLGSCLALLLVCAFLDTFDLPGMPFAICAALVAVLVVLVRSVHRRHNVIALVVGFCAAVFEANNSNREPVEPPSTTEADQ